MAKPCKFWIQRNEGTFLKMISMSNGGGIYGLRSLWSPNS